MSDNGKKNEKCTDDKIKITDYISITKDNLKDYLYIGWEKLCDIYIHNLISKGNEYLLRKEIIRNIKTDIHFEESDHDINPKIKALKAVMTRVRHKIRTIKSINNLYTKASLSQAKEIEKSYINSDHYIQECLLENLGSLRKLIIHRLFCKIVQEEKGKNEQCYNEYMAMGSTNITSDYDLTIKGSTSNDVMWKMFKKFIYLYGVTLPYAFDTNLYSSPLHLYTQPECLNVTASKKDAFINPNLKSQSYYLEYDNKNFTFVPSNDFEIDMELQFAFLKLYEADKTLALTLTTGYPKIKYYIKKVEILIENEDLKKNYDLKKAFEKLDKNSKEEITNLYNQLKITNNDKIKKNKKLIMDYKKQYEAQQPVQKYIYTLGDETYNKTGAELFKKSNIANYWSSEAYYTSSACNIVILETQMKKGVPFIKHKIEKKKQFSKEIIKKMYLCSAIENLADMIHHIDSHLTKVSLTKDDVMLTLIKFSKYLYRFYYSIEASKLEKISYVVENVNGKEKITVKSGLTVSSKLKSELIPRRKDQDKEKAKKNIEDYFEFIWSEEDKNNPVTKKEIMDKIKKKYYGMIEKELTVPSLNSTVRTGFNLKPAGPVRTSGVITTGSSSGGRKKRTKKKARKNKRRKRSKKRRK